MNKIKTLSFCTLLILVLSSCFADYWEPRNVKIDNVHAKDAQVIMDPSQIKELLVKSDFQCMTLHLDTNFTYEGNECESTNFRVIFFPNEAIESNCNAPNGCFNNTTVIKSNELERGELTLALTTKAEILPGIYSPTMEILSIPKNPNRESEASKLETIKLIVPYGNLLIPEVIIEAGNYQLKFEPHPLVNFQLIEFFKDTNPNNDDNDELLASFQNPPFEKSLTFTESGNGTQTFYVRAKALVEGKTTTIYSPKVDVDVYIPNL